MRIMTNVDQGYEPIPFENVGNAPAMLEFYSNFLIIHNLEGLGHKEPESVRSGAGDKTWFLLLNFQLVWQVL